jgi:VWFA-related protein
MSRAPRAVLVALVLLAPVLSAQQPFDSARGQAASLAQDRPTFRSGVRLVNVSVIAHDNSGQPVKNLTAADFRIYEDGKEQKIEVFAVEANPLAPAPSAASSLSSPAVFSNRLAERAAGGVTVILFDRLNSTWEDQKSARDQILKLLAKIRSNDRVALYVLESDTITVLHDFTSDAGRLIAVLNRYLGATSVELARSEEKAPDFVRTGVAAEDADTEAWLARTTTMVAEMYLRRRAELTTNALESIANHLAGIPGRKNLVWVSGAFPFVIPGDHGPQVMDKEVNRATRAINSADVAVYPVDIRGLIGAFVNPSAATAPVTRGAAPTAPVFTTMATTHPNQDTMRTIAEATGGRVYANTNAIGDAIRKAIDDSRVSYVLGYYSSRPDGDNKFRNINVKVNRSGVELRHRKGYLAAPAAVRDSRARLAALGRVMLSPIEASGISLTAEIARAGNEGTIVVRIDPQSLTWEPKKDLREAAIDVVIAQSVPGGKYFTIKETTVSLTADPERYQQMIADGLTLSSNFTALPDAYRLHVVVSDVASQSVGSLIVPLKK